MPLFDREYERGGAGEERDPTPSVARTDISISEVFALFDARDYEGLLRALVSAADPQSRGVSGMMLGNLGYHPALEPLIQALRSDDSAEVRESATKGLMNLKDPGAVPALRDALNDPDGSVRYAAQFALDHLEPLI